MKAVCARTGLATVEKTVTAYRVALSSYGPLKPKERLANEDPADWYRFDTPGRTIYAADDQHTAFREALSWAGATGEFLESLQKTADFFGVSPEALRKEVTNEWHRLHGMKPGYIPLSWRDDRLLYTLEFESGRWVDIADTDTLRALGTALRGEILGLGVTEQLTLSEVTSGNRALTSLLASWTREQVLDDGTYPMGIRFPSKHGSSGQGEACWAFWLRRTDVGLSDDPVTIRATQAITLDTSAFKRALKYHHISSW